MSRKDDGTRQTRIGQKKGMEQSSARLRSTQGAHGNLPGLPKPVEGFHRELTTQPRSIEKGLSEKGGLNGDLSVFNPN